MRTLWPKLVRWESMCLCPISTLACTSVCALSPSPSTSVLCSRAPPNCAVTRVCAPASATRPVCGSRCVYLSREARSRALPSCRGSIHHDPDYGRPCYYYVKRAGRQRRVVRPRSVRRRGRPGSRRARARGRARDPRAPDTPRRTGRRTHKKRVSLLSAAAGPTSPLGPSACPT